MKIIDFGQAVESLFRLAYPENLDVVTENALTTFLENCSDYADFRMAVKRTIPETLQNVFGMLSKKNVVGINRAESHGYKGSRLMTGARVNGTGLVLMMKLLHVRQQMHGIIHRSRNKFQKRLKIS